MVRFEDRKSNAGARIPVQLLRKHFDIIRVSYRNCRLDHCATSGHVFELIYIIRIDIYKRENKIATCVPVGTSIM